MAKPKKAAKKIVRARPATTRSAPPPAKTSEKRGAPAGGVLEWTQHGKDTWLAPDPEGDASRAGGRVKMLAQGWLDKANQPIFMVYRDAEYLGSDPTLEAAQRRAQYREKSANVLRDTIHGPDGLPAFLAVTKEERAKVRAAARATVAAVPGKADTLRVTLPEPAAARAAATRNDLAAERQTSRAERRTAKKTGVLDRDAVIKVTVDKNPRKPGTGAHARFALLMEHGGKTVGTFLDAKGNPETLENAIKDGRVSLEGEDT